MTKMICCLCSIVLLVSCTTNKTIPLPPEVITPPVVIENPAAKNIILLIGDGMGLSQISAGMYAANNHTPLEAFPVVGLQKTHSSDKLITDSAASATAIACGKKTYNGAIGLTPDSVAVQSILEEAESKGLATGLVSTSTIVHATPASFIAHNVARKNYEEIAADFLKTEIDIFIGGGKKYFDRREDGVNLLEAFGPKYQVSHFADQDLNMVVLDESKNFAYLTSDQDPLPFDQGRDYLVDAAQIATSFLDGRSEDGFFLMVEGSQIDWGGHANKTDYVLSEVAEYNQVIQNALDYAKADGNTLVIVTADHETGGFAIDVKSEMNQIVGKFTSTKHTGTMVPIFAYGPGSEKFAGIYDNTQIYHKMRDALGWAIKN